MSVIGSIGNLPTGICVDYFPLETLESNPILEAFTVPVLWVPKAIQTTIPRFWLLRLVAKAATSCSCYILTERSA